jgi:hypothetical protein
MIELLCAICQKPYYPRRPHEWFCNKCYHKWGELVDSHVDWVEACIREERARRHRENKDRERFGDFVYLGSRWDIDNGCRLVPRDDYYRG